MIAPRFERVLLQTVDLFRGEQRGSMVHECLGLQANLRSLSTAQVLD